jgi:hypothetical protein
MEPTAIQFGPVDPAICTPAVGDFANNAQVFFNTTEGALKVCLVENQWTTIIGGGGGGTVSWGQIAGLLSNQIDLNAALASLAAAIAAKESPLTFTAPLVRTGNVVTDSGGGGGSPVVPFIVSMSPGGPTALEVQSDGGVIINQRSGAVYANILDVLYQGVRLAAVTGTDAASAAINSYGGFNGAQGNFAVAALTGNIFTAGTMQAKHLKGGGTTPTVTDDGNHDSALVGKDAFCKVTVGTGVITAITITFGTAYPIAPVYLVGSDIHTDLKCVATTTGLTITRADNAPFTAGEVLSAIGGSF